MQSCQCSCCSTMGPPYPAGTFPVVRPPVPVVPMQPAAPVANLPAGATLAEVVTAFNALLASLRAAGFLQTGPTVER